MRNNVVITIMATKNVHCSYHLGDQLFALMFVNLAVKRTDDKFVFSVNPEYVDAVRGMALKSQNLEVIDHLVDGACECWMGSDGWYHSRRNPSKFIDFLIEFHCDLARRLSIPWTAPDKKEMLFPAESMDSNHALKDQSFDVLFVNSSPLSGQCHGFVQGWIDAVAQRHSKKFKMVVTHPCGDDSIPTTTTLGLQLNQIGELASRCKIIAGVANAPFLATFNELATPNVKTWLNYSCDLLNFDERVRHIGGIDQLDKSLEQA